MPLLLVFLYEDKGDGIGERTRSAFVREGMVEGLMLLVGPAAFHHGPADLVVSSDMCVFFSNLYS